SNVHSAFVSFTFLKFDLRVEACKVFCPFNYNCYQTKWTKFGFLCAHSSLNPNQPLKGCPEPSTLKCPPCEKGCPEASTTKCPPCNQAIVNGNFNCPPCDYN